MESDTEDTPIMISAILARLKPWQAPAAEVANATAHNVRSTKINVALDTQSTDIGEAIQSSKASDLDTGVMASIGTLEPAGHPDAQSTSLLDCGVMANSTGRVEALKELVPMAALASDHQKLKSIDEEAQQLAVSQESKFGMKRKAEDEPSHEDVKAAKISRHEPAEFVDLAEDLGK